MQSFFIHLNTMNAQSLFESGTANRMARVDEMLKDAEDINLSDDEEPGNANRLV